MRIQASFLIAVLLGCLASSLDFHPEVQFKVDSEGKKSVTIPLRPSKGVPRLRNVQHVTEINPKEHETISYEEYIRLREEGSEADELKNPGEGTPPLSNC